MQDRPTYDELLAAVERSRPKLPSTSRVGKYPARASRTSCRAARCNAFASDTRGFVRKAVRTASTKSTATAVPA